MSSYYEIFDIITKYSGQNAAITTKTYSNRILKVINSGKDIKNYDDTTSYLITKYTKKTYKSFITSIVVFLKATEAEPSLIEKYSHEMKRMNDIIEEETRNHEKTDKEKKNMVSREEIKNVMLSLRNLIKDRKSIRGDIKLFTDYQKYLVINLYYLIPPVRNDFIGCEVHDISIQDQRQQQDKNYIFLDTKKFILNRYKTKKTYGVVALDLPQELVDIIKEWFRIREFLFPRVSGVKELLLTTLMTPMGQVNLTQFLNRIFQKKVSTTMLRKSYISEKYPVTHTTNEMKKDANAMQHSIAVQQTVYRKK
jgi:integrase